MEHELSRVTKLKNIENWSVWKFQIRIILNANGSWEIVTGASEPPTSPEAGANEQTVREYAKNVAAWKKLDAMAQKIIATTIGEQPMLHIINCETAKAMWNRLVSIYEQKSDTSVHMLQQKWFMATMKPSDDMAAHIARLEDVAHRLKLMGEDISDSMIMTKILMTLPSSYNHFVSAWESAPAAERNLVNLTSRLMIEESRHAEHGEVESKALASKSYHGKGSQKSNHDNKNSRVKCFRCDKHGHFAKDCPDRKQKEVKCYRCDKHGHFAKDCPDRKQKDVSGSSYREGHIGEALTSTTPTDARMKTWYMDSGASDHMSHCRDWFVDFELFDKEMPVRVGDGAYIKAYGRGNIHIWTFNGSKWNRNYLSNVLFVPKLKYNLFSVGTAMDKGFEMQSNETTCKLSKQERIVAVGVREKKLYTMRFEVVMPNEASRQHDQPEALVTAVDTLKTWHEKMAHQNFRHVRKVLSQFQITVEDSSEPFCDECAVGKTHRLPFPTSVSKTTKIGEIIHADVCGPMQTRSIGGSRYFLLFKDDFSHFRTVYFIAEKSEVKRCMADFLRKMEKHCPRGVQTLRSDNGLEFVNRDIEELMHQFGVRHQKTVVYTPEQNGSAERENRTIEEAARTILHAKGFETRFWAEATNTAVHVLNHTGTSSTKGSTPYELWYGKKPDIRHLKIFGEEVYSHIPNVKRQKWDPKGERGIFVGYEENVKGYRIWNPEEDVIKIVRDVTFTGNTNPLNASKDNQKNNPDVLVPVTPEERREDLLQSDNEEMYEEAVENENAQNEAPPEERALRDRATLRPPNRYNDFVGHDEVLLTEGHEPMSYGEAIQSSEASRWKEAMKDEIESLHRNNVWELTQAPKGQNIMDNRWTFKAKRDTSGNVQRYKARLVARGFTQRPGIDYQETFSPVVRFDSLRAILAIAAQQRMRIQQFDVKTAFLYGSIDETIYMRQPEGYEDGTDRVCKLKRSLYGLKQSSRCWNRRFTEFLAKFDLTPMRTDTCIFTSYRKRKKLILAIYIDDGLIVAEDQESIDELLGVLKREFEITSDKANMFLGLQIEQQTDGSILVHQAAYTQKIIERFRMNEANPVSVPADPHQETCTEMHSIDQNEVTKAPYREAIGSLMYLSIATRPDITFAVNRASRYMEKPSKLHWNAVKRILKYLKGTIEYGLKFEANQDQYLRAYSDADYAGELETRRSTTEYLVKLGSSVISWNSQRQQTVALSTTDAEYMAACQTVKEIVWIKRLLEELTNSEKVSTTLYLDNNSAIQLIKNPVFHKRTKHIDVRYHYIRERYKDGDFSLEYVSTKDQLADILTKPLARQVFQYLRGMLCMNKEQRTTD